MTLPIRWTAKALKSLESAFNYIAADNPMAARALQDRIEAAVIALPDHPYLFRAGRLPGTRELVVHPNYIIVYRVLDAEIEVSNLLHARQKYP